MNFSAAWLQSCCLFLTLSSVVLAADADKGRAMQSGSLPNPESHIVDKWRGTWEVKATRREPRPVQEVTYVETFDWILDKRFLRSETSRKSDGGRSMSMVWYDILTKTYRFVIYDSSGLAVILPTPVWRESTQTMEWNSGFFEPLSYGPCDFHRCRHDSMEIAMEGLEGYGHLGFRGDEHPPKIN